MPNNIHFDYIGFITNNIFGLEENKLNIKKKNYLYMGDLLIFFHTSSNVSKHGWIKVFQGYLKEGYWIAS